MIRNISFLLHGTKHFTKEGYERAAKTFDNSVMSRSLQGKLCLVTGANQGLGLTTSEELAKRGAKLLMVCRNRERGEQAVAEVRGKTGNQDVHLKVCDVSSLESVAELAKDLEASSSAVYLLVNNAGVLLNERQTSVDGFDASFATNTLGAFVLTALLAPALARCPDSRVVTVSSGGMYTSTLDVADLQNQGMKKYDGVAAYAKDKRRQVAYSERFAELLGKKGVGVYTMHPGWAETEGVKKSIPGFYNFYKNSFRNQAQGVDTIVYLALQDQSQLEPGAFYLDRQARPKHLTLAGTSYTKQQVDTLWAELAKLSAKVIPPEALAVL